MNILLIVYDNDSYVSWFPHGLAYISSYLKRDGHNVKIYSQDVYHYSEEHLTQYLDENKFDVVGIGVIAGYYQYRKLLKLSEAINKSRYRKEFKYVLGGHGPFPEPEYFLRKTKADYVVLGEGEETICELLNTSTPSKCKGLVFIENDKLIKTGERKLIKNVDNIIYPDWDNFPIEHYVLQRQPGFSSSDRMLPVLSARGCPYKCNFCLRMDKGFRARSPESIYKEISLLKVKYNINAVDFADELLMSSKKRVVKICEYFLKNNLNIKWSCNGRLNFAEYDVLKLMKKAGCVFINYGIESLDDKMLEKMNKNLTVEQIIKGVENTNKVGIIPGLNIIFGNIGETKEILHNGVNFLKKYNKGGQLRTIRPVTPYPGSPLYYYAIEKGLLKDVEDFYEHKHVNSDLLSVNFTDLSDEDFYKELTLANNELIEDYYTKNKEYMKQQTEDLYINKNSSFRGFRQI